MSLAFEAMLFAREVHKNQVRKYTGNPYADHLAEVAGITSTIFYGSDGTEVAVAWLHDSIEDQEVDYYDLERLFGKEVAMGVLLLSDIEVGKNRRERKEKSRERLANAPGWIQTIKVADLISNTSSIVKHDEKFAYVYLEEKRLLLDVMTDADQELVKIARSQVEVTE